MTLIYCIKCGDKTNSIDEKVVITKNGRKRIAAVCGKCKGKKSMFISSSGKKKTDSKTKKKDHVDKKQSTKKTKKTDSATTAPKKPSYNLTTHKKQESTINCCPKCLKKYQQCMDKIKTIRP